MADVHDNDGEGSRCNQNQKSSTCGGPYMTNEPQHVIKHTGPEGSELGCWEEGRSVESLSLLPLRPSNLFKGWCHRNLGAEKTKIDKRGVTPMDGPGNQG